MSKINKQKLKIIGMHCTSCAMNIDWDLEDLNGVNSAKTSYGSQECVVEYDAEAVSLEEILKTVEKTGYKVQLTNE